VLLFIDFQKEYTEGSLKLPDCEKACQVASGLLKKFREAKAPVVHVIHQGNPDAALFNPETDMVAIPDLLSPTDEEIVVVKTLPNAFTCTNLEAVLDATQRKDLIVAGFMTHMCVDSTVRAASELGFRNVVIANACASRALPHPVQKGKIISAQDVHFGALAAISDRFATIATFSNGEFK
jgi:nicotinamidase-related amidase